MDKDLIHVLEKIANTLEENNDVLNRIACHNRNNPIIMIRNST